MFNPCWMISIILHWYNKGNSIFMLLYILKKLDAQVNRPSNEKEVDHHDSEMYWPISIKETIQWFPFSPFCSILQVTLKHVYHYYCHY